MSTAIGYSSLWVFVAAALVFGVYVHLLRHGTVHWSAYLSSVVDVDVGKGGLGGNSLGTRQTGRHSAMPPHRKPIKATQHNIKKQY